MKKKLTTEIKFIDPSKEKVLCTYSSYISMEELSETCELLMFENILNNIRIDMEERGELQLQFSKEKGEKLKRLK